MIMAVERTHDGVGTDTAAGLLWVGAGCQAGGGADGLADYKNYYWPWGGSSPGTETIGIFPPTFGTGTDGVTTAVYPVMICKGGPYLNPPRCLLGCFASDYVVDSTNVVPIYGANVSYYRPSWDHIRERLQVRGGERLPSAGPVRLTHGQRGPGRGLAGGGPRPSHDRRARPPAAAGDAARSSTRSRGGTRATPSRTRRSPFR
jgi:hypothetical protein